MRYHYIPTRIIKLEKNDNFFIKDIQQWKLTHHWWKYHLVKPLWKVRHYILKFKTVFSMT